MMASLKLLALGAIGSVGRSALVDVLEHGPFDEVIIGDIDVGKAKKVIRELRDHKLSFVKVNAEKYSELKRVIKKCDVVMNALPFKYDYVVTRAAIDVGVSGDDVSAEESQFDLDALAKKKDVVFVPGVGATPGITNILVAKAASMMDEIVEVKICWAAFRCAAPSPGLLTTTFWEFDPKTKERAYYENGEFHPVPPFTGAERIRFNDPIGEQTVYYVPHPETRTIPMYFRSVRKVEVKGTWPEETMNLLKFALDFGVYDDRPIKIYGKRGTPLMALHEMLLQLPKARETRIWGYGLYVRVVGRQKGNVKEVVMRTRHPPMDVWGKDAYFKNIGLPLSIGASMIAKGEVKSKGVVAPEAAFDPNAFLKELAERGITVDYEVR